RVVLAKTAPGIEEKAIDGVATEGRGRERVHERLVMKPGEDCGDESTVRFDLPAKVARESDGAWILVARELQVVAALGLPATGEGAREGRTLRVPHRLEQRCTSEQLVVRGQKGKGVVAAAGGGSIGGPPRQARRMLEREQP